MDREWKDVLCLTSCLQPALSRRFRARSSSALSATVIEAPGRRIFGRKSYERSILKFGLHLAALLRQPSVRRGDCGNLCSGGSEGTTGRFAAGRFRVNPVTRDDDRGRQVRRSLPFTPTYTFLGPNAAHFGNSRTEVTLDFAGEAASCFVRSSPCV